MQIRFSEAVGYRQLLETIGCTARFLWLYEQRRELSVEHGPQPLAEAAQRAIERVSRRPRGLRKLIRRS